MRVHMQSIQENKIYTLELFRFIFAIIILSYHFYLYYLSIFENVFIFSKAYLGDEFFFFISGYFIAKSALETEESNIIGKSTLCYIAKRIRRVAFPYYFSWFIGFVLLHSVVGISCLQVFRDFANSIIELLFLDMAGFPVLFQTSGVAWYFSGLLISSLLLYPFLLKYRESYCLIAAPVLSILIYGFLSNVSPALKAPHTLITNIGMYKGLFRALAGINMGVFIYGILSIEDFLNWISNRKIIANITGIISAVVYFTYMIIGGVDNDFIVIPFIAILVALILSREIFLEPFLRNKKVLLLGKLSVYIYFSQIIIYAKRELIFSIAVNNIWLYVVFILFCMIIALLEYVVGEKLMRKA